MAVSVLGEVAIGELQQFVAVFGTDGLEKRREHGCRGAQVFAPVGAEGRAVVLLEFDDVESFEAFRTDPTAAPVMRRGGAQGPPSFTVLQRIADYDA